MEEKSTTVGAKAAQAEARTVEPVIIAVSFPLPERSIERDSQNDLHKIISIGGTSQHAIPNPVGSALLTRTAVSHDMAVSRISGGVS